MPSRQSSGDSSPIIYGYAGPPALLKSMWEAGPPFGFSHAHSQSRLPTLSLLKNPQIEAPKARSISDYVYMRNSAFRRGELKNPAEPSAWSQDKPNVSVNERQLHEPNKPRERHCPLSPIPRTANLHRCAARAPRSVVNLNYNIWIEHCHHPFDVPTPQRIEERAAISLC